MTSEIKNVAQVFILDETGGYRRGDLHNIEDILSKGEPTWVHIQFLDTRDREIFSRLNIPSDFLDKLTSMRDRPRIISEENTTFLSLRAINFNPGSDPDDMVFLRLYSRDNLIVTLRTQKVLAVQNIIESLDTGKGPGSIDELSLYILTNISVKISEVIYEAGDRLDEIEEKIIGDFDIKLRSDLSTLRHQIINIRRYLLPQQEVIEKFSQITCSDLTSPIISDLRELNEKYSRYQEKIESLRDKAAITHEEVNTIYSERLNKTMFLLSIVATVFMPLSFITGLLGINVGGIPGTDSPLAFIVVTLILIVIGLIEVIIFKHNKWI